MLDFFLLVAWFKSCKSFSCFHWGLDQDLSRELLLSVWFSCYLLHESGERDHVPPGLYKVCSVLRHACKFQNVNHTLKAEVTLKKNSRLDFLSHWRWLSHRKKSSEMEKPGTLWNSLETETYSPMTMSRPRQSSKWLLFALAFCWWWTVIPKASGQLLTSFSVLSLLETSHTGEGMELCLSIIKHYWHNFRHIKAHLITTHNK